MTSASRKLVKAVTWRMVGLVSLATLTFILTRSWVLSGTLSLWHALVQVGLYYLHERAWDGVRWGKMQGVAVQMTGLSGAGKSTLAQAVAKRLHTRGLDVEILDGDEYRTHLCAGLGFSRADRIENIRRLAFVAHKLAGVGRVSIIAAINPYEEARAFLPGHSAKHLTVFVDAGLETVVERDTKGLYKRAMLPADDPKHVPHFTGVSDPFEAPTAPDLVINTSKQSIEQCVAALERALLARMSQL